MQSHRSSNPTPDDAMGTRPPLVLILGPTAVGKTEISIQLAERLSGEIVSADSRLFYRGMDIGTAKPTQEERKGVAHHLIDVADPDELWSVAQFQSCAQAIIAHIHQRKRLPFLVGGSGQYIQAIIQGWQIPTAAVNTRLRTALESWASEITPAGLHERLKLLDPQAAQSIDARNVRRTIRALEVIFTTGKPFSDQRRQSQSPYRLLQLGIIRPREELYRRVDQRIEAMLQNGLLEEVKHLLEQGYTPTLPTMSAIGYLEICQVLAGKMSLEEAIISMKRRTRVFVRRQANWFKPGDPNIQWFTASDHTTDDMLQVITNWLEKK